MRALLALLLVATSINAYTQACCCTGAGANYTVLPNLNKHVIGLRYVYRNFYNETKSLNPDLNGTITNQNLSTLEVFGRFNLTQRLQLSVFLPVSFIQQKTNHKTSRISGLGDMSLLLQYSLLDPLKCSGKKSKHQFRVGMGTKLPSGEFNITEQDLFTTNLQLGTGSVDFVASSIYTFRYQDFGFNAIAAYRLNTPNTQRYRFGNRAQTGINFFYVVNLKEIQLMPSLAFNYEHQFSNKKDGRTLSFTGGDFLTTSVGFDAYYKQFAFSSTITPVLMNHLNWRGENKNRLNVEAGVFYNFSTNQKTKSQLK